MRHVAFIGIGANLDGPQARVRAAFDALDALPQTRVTGRSPLYRSAPLGGPPQPDYVNAVARVETALSPQDLLAALLAVESRHGRVRGAPNAPRTLDLDLLLYDALTCDQPGLRLPHPRMHARRFVLAPLADLEPAARIPGQGTAAELLARCAAQALERID
ncbi:MAG: 2-amino-4-hydroxy-6-hydroxymethyldihydropteridine diphosphokinase [Burkholderiales bacterium]|nr:2-amino-4-hydroxy-6-hydroxymethyldihydropteridine diphosphokinase [Burkholderiales bacterium]